MILRLVISLFFIHTLSVIGMEVPNNVYDSARSWNHLSARAIINESLQGLSDFEVSIPKSLLE